jgi:uncharacterized membrane protein YciS (DUF1049 family)
VPISKEDLDKASQYGRTLVDSINTMDQYSVNKAEDIEMASQGAMAGIGIGIMALGVGIGALIAKSPKIKELLKKSEHKDALVQAVVFVPALFLSLIITPFLTIKSKSYEKEASRIARHQARENELKNPKYFVIYNKEQIEEARKIAKTLPDILEKKKSINPISGYSDAIASIKSLTKDHNKYLQWKQEHLKAEKERLNNIYNETYSDEQLKNAQNDQDNLLRTIRKIELYSQNYIANTKMAYYSTLGLETLVGLGAGWLASGIARLLQKTKIISLSPEKLAKLGFQLKMFTPAAIILPLAFYSTKAVKEAAKIGRFKAKQELLQDPHNFITYSDEQMQSVKDIKAPKEQKGLFEKIKDNTKFFFQLVKDYKAFEENKKTIAKEERKLDKALLQVNVSDKQMQNAKSLQKNAFKTFEKMDEMAQRYTDDTEAAMDIAKQTFNSTTSLAEILILLYIAMNKKALDFVQKILNKIKNKNMQIALGVSPLIAVMIAQIAMTIKGAQIEKQAGRIGVMEAMEDLKDPRYFVNND